MADTSLLGFARPVGKLLTVSIDTFDPPRPSNLLGAEQDVDIL